MMRVLFLLLLAAALVSGHQTLRALRRQTRALGDGDTIVEEVKEVLDGESTRDARAQAVQQGAPIGLSRVDCNGMVGFEIETGKFSVSVSTRNQAVFEDCAQTPNMVSPGPYIKELYSMDLFHSVDHASVKNYGDDTITRIPIFTWSTDQCAHGQPMCAATEFVFGPMLLDKTDKSWHRPFSVMYTLAQKSNYVNGGATKTIRELNGDTTAMAMEKGKGWCYDAKNQDPAKQIMHKMWTDAQMGAFTLGKNNHATSGGVQVNFGVPIDNLGYDRPTLSSFSIKSLCTLYGSQEDACDRLTNEGRALGDSIATDNPNIKHQLKVFFAQMALMGASFDTTPSHNSKDPSSNAGSVKDHAVQLIKTGINSVYKQYLTEDTKLALRMVSTTEQARICKRLVEVVNTENNRFPSVTIYSRLDKTCMSAFSEGGPDIALSMTGKPIDVTTGAQDAKCPMMVVESRLKENPINQAFTPQFTESWNDYATRMRRGAIALSSVTKSGVHRGPQQAGQA